MNQQNSGVVPLTPWNIARSVFTITGLVLESFVLSWAGIATGLISRSHGQYIARIWARIWLFLAGIKVRVHGLDHLDVSKRYVFVSNHQSALDIPTLYAALPFKTGFISKRALFFIPVLGWGMLAIGHIGISRSNNRKARDSIMKAVKRIKKDNFSLVIFPEGTRSETGELGEFKRGSFTLALRSGADVVPVAVSGTRNVQPKRSYISRPGTVTVHIGEPISVSGEKKVTKPELAQEAHAQIKQMLNQ